MKDPVCDSEGNSFERSAIESWLQEHGTSPITRTAMTIANLVPNRVLKDAIESFLSSDSGDQSTSQAAGDAVYVPSVDEISQVSVKAVPVPPGYLNQISDIGEPDDQQPDLYHLVHVSLVPGEGTTKGPVDVSCVIDISGSMGTEARLQTASGDNESFGLSILDIVKHSVSTIIKSLTKMDRLAIVSFSDNSRIEMPLTAMDEAGQSLAMRTLQTLEPTASTNLWAGLQSGLEVLRRAESNPVGSVKRLASTLVFTDGVP